MTRWSEALSEVADGDKLNGRLRLNKSWLEVEVATSSTTILGGGRVGRIVGGQVEVVPPTRWRWRCRWLEVVPPTRSTYVWRNIRHRPVDNWVFGTSPSH